MKKLLAILFFLISTSAFAQLPPSGLKLWLKADDLVLADNAPVTSWNDASGLGNNFSIIGSPPPVFKAGCPSVLNGKPYITWNGTTPTSAFQRSDVLGMAPNTPRTFIAVYRLYNPSMRSFVIEQGDFTTPGTYYGPDANTWLTAGNKFGTYATNSSYDANLSTDNQFHLQYLTANTMTIGANINSDTEYRIDNNFQTLTQRSGSGTYQSFASANEMRIGGWVEISEVIVYNRALTAIERGDIVTYLQNKYGSFPIAPPPSPPTISSFTPDSSPAGSVVTITGTNFTGASDVKFNGVAATSFTVISPTSITATVPAGLTVGPVTISVQCSTATSVNNFTPTYVPFGNTITCNGTTDYVTIPDNPSLRPSSQTLSTWVKFSALPSGGFGPLLSKVLGSNINDSFVIWYLSGTLRAQVNDVSGSNTPVQISWTPVLNQWYHIAFSFDNTSKAQILYLNGAPVASNTAIAGPQYDSSPVRIAADVDNGTAYVSPVTMDEVRIWNVTLTPSQILSTINSTLAGNETGLVAYYKMDEVGQGSGITVNNGASATGALLNGITVGTPCNTPIFTILPSPTITLFSPSSGIPGTSVTMTGTNFSPVPANNIVKFNGTTATVSASTTTSVTTSVPAGATSGTISVTIGCFTTSSSGSFTVCTPPSAPTVTPGSSCGTSTVALSASGAIGVQEYRWYDTASGAISLSSIANFTTPVLTATTLYYVSIYEPAGGCESPRSSVSATINSKPAQPNITGTTSFCTGDSTILSAPVGFTSYAWSDGVTTQTRTVSTVITVTVNVTNASGCQSIDSPPVTISLLPVPSQPTISLSSPSTFCQGASVTLSASGFTSYLWSDGSTVHPRVMNTSIAALTLKVTNSNGCQSIASLPITITVNPLPAQPVVTSSKPPSVSTVVLCQENNESTTLSTPSGFVTYAWSTGQNTSSFTTSQSGSYAVSVTDGKGCTSLLSSAIIVNQTSCTPVITTITVNAQIEGAASQNLIPLITTPGTLNVSSIQILTQPPSGALASIDANGILNVNYAGVHFSGTEEVTIKACDINASCATGKITIEVQSTDIGVYNAISPNGDGKNETFFLQYIELIPETTNNKVIIFNRWGDVVWEGSNYDNDKVKFIGLSNSGDELPAGTYYYRITFASGKQSKTGFISFKK
ncbi:hypothetical protein BH10BAC4_BH10BAC4_09300 [soil metagenome]